MDEQDKQQDTSRLDTSPDGESSTPMLKILAEKDKIILSLKEASTKRDRLNESQIRLLSEDNDKKLRKIEQLNEKLSLLQSSYAESSSKLNLYKEKVDQSTTKFDELKTILKEYKHNISQTLGDISDMVASELTSREERNSKLANHLQENYRKLEGRLEKLDSEHRTTLERVSQQQGQAKKLIRDAVQRLQNALDMLDLGSPELQLNPRIIDDFNSILRDSEAAFTDLNSRVRETDIIIKKIENLNLQLAETPKLDRYFTEHEGRVTGEQPPGSPDAPQPIPAPAGESSEELGAFLEAAYQLEEEPAPPQAGPKTHTPGTGPSTAMSRAPGPPMAAPGVGPAGPAVAPQSGPPIQGPPSAGPGPEGAPAAFPGTYEDQRRYPPSPEYPTPPSGTGAPGAAYPPASGLPYHGSGYAGRPATYSGGGAPTMVIDSAPKETSIKPDDDLIMRESPNLAPYNWDMLPATSPLLRFRRLLNAAKKAEHRENYTKALDIYEVVKQQRTIQDDALANNILEDQVEAINRLARAQVSNNEKRESIERYYRQERTDDKRHDTDQN